MKVAVFKASGQGDLQEQLEEFFKRNPAAEVVAVQQSESRPMYLGITLGQEISLTLLYR
ncbi:MAG: hypothetical protein Q8P49_02325 [Candidatus Liptonbacteria bacterium]|nr:hypothetical protein [Candidatus Liptonbacteria bacterium]